LLLNHQHTHGRAGDSPPRILVAGAADGVGRACAHIFAGLGADLVLCDHDGPELHRVARSTGSLARFCDIASETSVEIFAAEILNRFDRLHVLVNAAGCGYVRSLGMMRISRALMPALRNAGGTKLIANVAPKPSLAQISGLFPYAGSDGAFARLSEAIALQGRSSSIRTVTVVPGIGGSHAAAWHRHDIEAADTVLVSEVDAHAVASRIADLVCESIPALCRDRVPTTRPGKAA
jgi:NAD(P)-dependent dehydrogenase (short-subunit alcohol dehydrogenase family)